VRRAKLFFAVLGFLLAATSVALDNRLIGWVAMSVLAVALALRLWLGRRG
jgi:hypothetical protein